MISLILTLVIIGVVLYFLESLPMDATIKLVIKVVIVICAILFILSVFGVADLPVPRLR